MQAGAAQNEWYADEMLREREALRSEESVQAAMQLAWERLGMMRGCSRGLESRVSRAEYTTLCRKIYLVLKAWDYEADFDAFDCLQYVASDWAEDARGDDTLDRAAFFNCFFEVREGSMQTCASLFPTFHRTHISFPPLPSHPIP